MSEEKHFLDIPIKGGFLYCVINESMPGMCKIGYTEGHINKRLKQLFSTSLPTPFTCFALRHMDEPYNKEKIIHRAFARFRINDDREFF